MTEWRWMIGGTLGLMVLMLGIIVVAEGDEVNLEAIAAMGAVMLGTMALIFGGAALFMRWLGGALYYNAFEPLAQARGGQTTTNAMGEKQLRFERPEGCFVVEVRVDAGQHARDTRQWTRFALEGQGLTHEALEVELKHEQPPDEALPESLARALEAISLTPRPALKLIARPEPSAMGLPAGVEVWCRGVTVVGEELIAQFDAITPALRIMAGRPAHPDEG